MDKVDYAQLHVRGTALDRWWQIKEATDPADITWELFTHVLQKHLASQRTRLFDVDKKQKRHWAGH